MKLAVSSQLEVTMIRALVQPSTPPYQPLSSPQSEGTEGKFKGKVVREAQLNCFYISPGGKKPKEKETFSGSRERTSERRAPLESGILEGSLNSTCSRMSTQSLRFNWPFSPRWCKVLPGTALSRMLCVDDAPLKRALLW